MPADLISVLEAGAMVERGAHAALLTQRGHYAALVQSQMEIDAVAAAIPVTANGTHSRRRAHRGCTSTSGTKGGV